MANKKSKRRKAYPSYAGFIPTKSGSKQLRGSFVRTKASLKDIKSKYSVFFYCWQIVRLLTVGIMLGFLPQQNAYSFRAMIESYEVKNVLIPPTPAPYPENVTEILPPEVTAESVIIQDVESGAILYEKNPDARLYPASTTKIMTALVSLETYKLTDVVTVGTPISEGQLMELLPGEKITVENLLYGILVHSANDAAYALAEHYPGGVQAYVTKMNLKAQEYGLANTHFTNSIGFDDPDHYTNVKDLINLSMIAIKNQTFSKIVAVPQITVSDTTFTVFHNLKNINELLGKIPGVSGIKTGWTENAGQSLVTSVIRNNHKVLIVILKSEDRFKETEQLLNWVFTYHTWKEFSQPIP